MAAIRRLRVQRKKRPFVFVTLLSLSLSLTFYSLFTILPSAERGYTLRLEMYTILFLVCLYDFASPPPTSHFCSTPVLYLYCVATSPSCIFCSDRFDPNPLCVLA